MLRNALIDIAQCRRVSHLSDQEAGICSPSPEQQQPRALHEETVRTLHALQAVDGTVRKAAEAKNPQCRVMVRCCVPGVAMRHARYKNYN